MLQQLLEAWGVYYIDYYINNNKLRFSNLSPKRVTKIAIGFSFLVGFIATLITVLFDVIMIGNQSLLSVDFSILATMAVVNLLVIALEFWLLFHIGFIVTARYIYDAEQQQPLGIEIKHTLVRAVLELDEPAPKQSFGLNPYRKRSKHYWLLLALYKVKVLFSNVVAKVLLRKIIGRGGARSYVPLISTVITGFWDAWVQPSVLEEVRLRIAARLYILEIIKTLKHTNPSQNCIKTLARMVAVRIELFGNYNANLDYLLNQIESLYRGAVAGQDELFAIDRLFVLYTTLSRYERKNISQIAGHLLVFKRHRFSEEEKKLVEMLGINSNDLSRYRRVMTFLRDY